MIQESFLRQDVEMKSKHFAASAWFAICASVTSTGHVIFYCRRYPETGSDDSKIWRAVAQERVGYGMVRKQLDE